MTHLSGLDHQLTEILFSRDQGILYEESEYTFASLSLWY